MYIKRPECGNFAHLFEDVLDLMKRADLRPVECVEQVELGRVEGRLCRKDATKPLVRVLVRQLGTGAGVRQLQTNSRHRRAWGKSNRTNAYKVGTTWDWRWSKTTADKQSAPSCVGEIEQNECLQSCNAYKQLRRRRGTARWSTSDEMCTDWVKFATSSLPVSSHSRLLPLDSPSSLFPISRPFPLSILFSPVFPCLSVVYSNALVFTIAAVVTSSATVVHHHHFICPIIQQCAHLHEYNSRKAGQQGPI